MAMGITVTDYDREVYEKELRDFLPDKIIDCHIHIWKREFQPPVPNRRGLVNWPWMVAKDCTFEDMELSYKQFFPDKKVTAVLMGNPPADHKLSNAYVKELHDKTGLPAFYLTSWDTPAEEIEHAMKVDGFCGIKPYLNAAPPFVPAKEIRIFDFLPHEHLEVVDRLGGKVMLHIARDLRLRDPLNIVQLMEIEKRYKNLKLIVAHIGRAYSPQDLGDAFDTLEKTENMVFDFTANCCEDAIEECIRRVGTKRLHFGSDLPIIKMRMYRRTDETGFYYNYVPRGMYGDVSGDPHMREVDYPEADRITTFMYEELLAFKGAARTLKLTDSQIEDIMCNNTAKLFDMERFVK
ncbi:MAG: hypothetical protein E7654_01610 [Ruminococcaceae bacterium]|nr:hypothetical protein [Oscillospiraceae bacterium]